MKSQKVPLSCARTEWPRYELGPLTIDGLSLELLIERVGAALRQGHELKVTYLNAHGFNLLYANPSYASVVRGFDIVFCDGFGSLLACRFLGAHVPERMTPPDFIGRLVQQVAQEGLGVFFVGDAPGVADRARASLPDDLQTSVFGCHHGYFSREQEEEVVEKIRASKARLVVVGTGMMRQEAFIERAQAMLPGRVWFAVGAMFSWMAGVERRGPRWATDNGLEWLCRLATQPRHVAKRYLLGLPVLAARVLRHRVVGDAFTTVRGSPSPVTEV